MNEEPDFDARKEAKLIWQHQHETTKYVVKQAQRVDDLYTYLGILAVMSSITFIVVLAILISR